MRLMRVPAESIPYEQAIAAIVSQMPIERRAQVLDFARYLLEIDRRNAWQDIQDILTSIHAQTAQISPEELDREIDAALEEVRAGV